MRTWPGLIKPQRPDWDGLEKGTVNIGVKEYGGWDCQALVWNTPRLNIWESKVNLKLDMSPSPACQSLGGAHCCLHLICVNALSFSHTRPSCRPASPLCLPLFFFSPACGSHPHLADGVWSSQAFVHTWTRKYSRLQAESTILILYIHCTSCPEGPWNMQSSGMHNTWAQQERKKTLPSPPSIMSSSALSTL